jgi:uncharacterized protein (DUF2252 family)
MKVKPIGFPSPDERQKILALTRNLKMARSPHAYVRGNTIKFYEGLESLKTGSLPEGPPVWICGDCHVGNLGPVADANGRVEIEIRDLDQSVIGNPAHDLIRLGLSLASAARGSDLPGVITAKMLEQMMDGYERAFDDTLNKTEVMGARPESARLVMRRALRRSWRHLAKERIENTKPDIPLGKRFWPVSEKEQNAIETLVASEAMQRLVTLLRSRENDASVDLLDAAYWVKGCSSLGRLRYAVLLNIGQNSSKKMEVCLIDIKEAATAAAPHYPDANMPQDNAERVEIDRCAGAVAAGPYDRARATHPRRSDAGRAIPRERRRPRSRAPNGSGDAQNLEGRFTEESVEIARRAVLVVAKHESSGQPRKGLSRPLPQIRPR